MSVTTAISLSIELYLIHHESSKTVYQTKSSALSLVSAMVPALCSSALFCVYRMRMCIDCPVRLPEGAPFAPVLVLCLCMDACHALNVDVKPAKDAARTRRCDKGNMPGDGKPRIPA